MNDDGYLSLVDLPPAISTLQELLQPDAQSLAFRQHVEECGTDLKIDYRDSAWDFNKSFFVRNYLKCALYLEFLRNHEFRLPDFALDLGGGAGPFSLALKHQNKQAATSIVDCNYDQVAIGLMLSAVAGLQHVSTIRIADIFKADLETEHARLVSYWTCENRNVLCSYPSRRRTIFGRLSILVDYPAVVLAEAQVASQFGGRVTNLAVAKKTLCPQLSEMIGQTSITYGGICVEYS